MSVETSAPERLGTPRLLHAVSWATTIACFAYHYLRVDAAAGPIPPRLRTWGRSSRASIGCIGSR